MKNIRVSGKLCCYRSDVTDVALNFTVLFRKPCYFISELCQWSLYIFRFFVNLNLGKVSSSTHCKIANYDTDYIFSEGATTGSKQSAVV